MKFVTIFLLLTLNLSALTQPSQDAVADLEQRVEQLEDDVGPLRQTLDGLDDFSDDSGWVMFLFGAFCALWAQNTRRNPWLWFFLGVFFSVITVLILLNKNSRDLNSAGKTFVNADNLT